MNYERQQRIVDIHLICHQRFGNNLPSETPEDPSCIYCYPPSELHTLPPTFETFWNWYQTIRAAETYSGNTPRLLSRLRYYLLVPQVVPAVLTNQLVEQLIFSIRYSIRYVDFAYPYQDLKRLVLTVATLTNGFELDPETLFNSTEETQPDHFDPLIEGISPPRQRSESPENMSLSEDQFKALMKGLNQQFQATAQTIVNGLPPAADAPKRENNLVKIETFSGKDDEDAVDWVQQFEAAAKANGWTEDRLVAIAAGHLRGAALDWYLD